ncbi:MAG: type II toxin-antitoxin system RelB/DinJ family antitoxin [Magnetococcales bacterium]|nr:type II toxin-antitoxin system RelB/DinJ family antitoxin [Magnetococcales bacterium]
MMANTETYVRARVDKALKERASVVLASMGLNMSDAIRLMLMRVIDEERLPFEIKSPNVLTTKAIEELEQGKGKKLDSKEDLFEDLGI